TQTRKLFRHPAGACKGPRDRPGRKRRGRTANSRKGRNRRSHQGAGAKDSAGDEYRQAVLDPRPTGRIKAGSKSPGQRERYRPDKTGASATSPSAAPASSGQGSSRGGAVKHGEDHGCAKWGNERVRGATD